MLELIDPENSIFQFKMFREDCTVVDGTHIKDLRNIRNRHLNDIMMIDNLAYSFAFQMENGVPIRPFIKEKQDLELKFIADKLETIT